jgi:hypothetical protein
MLSVFITNCDENAVGISTDQRIVFEVKYENNAWGKQLKGFIILGDGTVKIYENPAQWNKVDTKNGISMQQMKENILNAAFSEIKISKQDISRYTPKIDSLTNLIFSKPIIGGADRGVTSYYAYRFDAFKLIYEPILLGETGNQEMHNKDKLAIEISAWLNEIIDKVH